MDMPAAKTSISLHIYFIGPEGIIIRGALSDAINCLFPESSALFFQL